MTKLVVGSATDVGLVRSNNQDQYLVMPGLYAVADGMGGHAAGEVASQTAIESLRDTFSATRDHTPRSLVEAAKTANRAVWDRARANRGMLGMGTTLVALAVVQDEGEPGAANGMAIAHIGDSRAYLYRDGALAQVTTDHSLVQELVDDGQITEDEAAVHPQRHVLTRALGVEPSVEVDLLPLSPQHGDRYLLCSDGLPREASSDQIGAVLSRYTDPAEAAKELVALANSKGGSDNVTVVVVDVLSSDPTGEALRVVPGPATSTGMGPVGLGGRAEDGSTHPGLEPPGPATGERPARHSPSPLRADGSALPGPEAPTMAGRSLTATAVVGPARARLQDAGPAPSTGHRQRVLAPASRRRPFGRRARTGPRWLTLRVVGFLLLVCAVIGGAVGGLAWYARSSYFVGLASSHIVIFQGRPGGVLWFQPTVAQRTAYTTRSVLAYQTQQLEAGKVEGTLADARSYIANLVAAKVQADGAAHPGVTTTTPPVTTSPATSGKKPAKNKG